MCAFYFDASEAFVQPARRRCTSDLDQAGDNTGRAECVRRTSGRQPTADGDVSVKL